MKVTFVLPDLNYVSEYMPDYSGTFSLGIGYLSSALKKAGHSTSLIHITKMPDKEWFWQKIDEYNPDLIGFSFFTHQFELVKKLASWAKEKKDIPIIAGGTHPTICPEEVVFYKDIDMVCLGEGEDAMVALCDKLEKDKSIEKSESIWIKRNGNVIKNPVMPLIADLDKREYPDRTIFDFKNLTDAKLGMISILAGRGCPFNCRYCCNFQYRRLYPNPKNYIRFRKPDYVIDEILVVRAIYPSLWNIHFVDDTFCLDKNWLKNFLVAYKKKINMPFDCNSRVNLLTEEIIALMKDAGCEKIWLGVESGNPGIRKKILGRDMDNQIIKKVFGLLRKHKIQSLSYNMVGIPGEKLENTLETIKLNAQLAIANYHIAIFQPYPSTELYERCVNEGYLKERKFNAFFDESVLEMPDFPKEAVKFSYKYFYIFVKLYRIANKIKPPALSRFFEKTLDKIYLSRNTKLLLRLYPIVFVIICPVVFLKRQLLMFCPNSSRRLKKIITDIKDSRRCKKTA